ncbi:hypothetical protein BCU70_02375 [Vibrio sp. 10N.286.49.C2]|uniref:hypothetical protein n=1 Tax=unclassified Vibrio TaxID=2614977 RepID=UPI000C8155D0|nr:MULTISPECIES: hypothetical protein [unclassified Vibrio]PMH38147.1 hypothetical protein BCU70_02375 [Vibrio sp. 10N.286.49.C2]PMH53647.1 hypothetical protein BCU66_12460 [Vibrio sp. 10N.286.49.B1]
MKTTLITSIMSLGLVTACGGGGGGGDSSGGGSSTPAQTPPVTATPAPPAAATRTMSDLTIPDDLDYKPVEALTLTVDASGSVSGRALVSVYTEFESQLSGEVVPVYDSRIASQSLKNGLGELEFSSPEHIKTVLVEIWTHDGNPPLQKLVAVNSSNLSW